MHSMSQTRIFGLNSANYLTHIKLNPYFKVNHDVTSGEIRLF